MSNEKKEYTQEMTPELMKTLEGLLPVPKTGVKFTPEKFIEKKIPEKYCPVFTQRAWTKGEELTVFRTNESGKFDEEFISEMARITITDFYLPSTDGSVISFKADASGSCDKSIWENVKHGLRAQCYHNAEKLSGIGEFTKEGLGS